MKIAKRSILLLSIAALSAGCNSGSSGGSSSDSIDGAQVEYVFPPNGATNIGLGEAIQFKLNKNVNPSLVKQYITLSNSSNNNSNEEFKIIDNNGTYDITPMGGFQPDTTYNFSINIPESNSSNIQKASTNSSTMTTQPSYKIFVTNKAVEGNLGNPNTGMNAKEWADNLCNTDTARPDTSVMYKAMMGIPDLRAACDDNGYCGAGHNIDWVMQANTTYYNVDTVAIATTNAFGTFTFPTANIIRAMDYKAWTGLSKEWVNSNNCNNWSSRKDEHNGRVGWVDKTNERLIDYEKHQCNKDRVLYCVQQPQAVITAPELSPVNQYRVSNFNAPITVMINTVNPVNPATVTANSFIVIAESATTPIPGTITNNGSNSFTFTPSIAYAPGKQYYIKLTTDIKDNLGTPIVETTLFFYTSSANKLLFMTDSDFWGDLGSLPGADSKCQADAKCPAGKTCKAVLMQAGARYACTDASTCGGINSKDWVLTPNTTYLNTKGQIISTTNATATFGNGSGKFLFTYPISENGGKAWTGFDQYFMIVYDGGSPVTCSQWSIGNDGINALGGIYGDARSTEPYAFISAAGGCSKYTNKIDYGVYVDKQCNIDGGCSERHLYCAEQ